MKKIVGIIAAASVAASMFAVDVSAQLKQKTVLFSDAKTVLTTPETPYDVNNTHFKLSAAKDGCGATFLLHSEDAKFDNITLWCKPMDNLKISLGGMDVGSISRGTFGWWHKAIRVDKRGVLAEFDKDALSVKFASFGNPLLDLNAEGYGMVGNFFLSGAYNLGAAGTVQGYVTKGADINAYGVGGWEQAVLTIGVDYDHMGWQQTGFYADVFANLDVNKGAKYVFDEVGSQLGGQFCKDALKARLTAMVAYGHKYGADKADVSYGFLARVEYALGATTVYGHFDEHEMQDKKYNVEIGADTSVGGAGLNAAVLVGIDASGKETKVTYSIPLTFTVGM